MPRAISSNCREPARKPPSVKVSSPTSWRSAKRAFANCWRPRKPRWVVLSLNSPSSSLATLLPASTTTLLLIRHAEVDVKYHRVFGGRIDMDLSARGHEQATALAAWLKHKPIDAVYASPMKRVQQTLIPLVNSGVPPPVILPDLREVDFGDWTGLGWEAVHEKFGAR